MASSQTYPRLDVNLDAMEQNARAICALCGKQGIRVAGVIKFSDGSIPVARAYASGGCAQIAVSRAVHLGPIKTALPGMETMLIRIPMLSEMETVARDCDIVLISEKDSLIALDDAAARLGTCPGVVLMLDVGDLREGVTDIGDLCALASFAEAELKHLRLRGVGTGFACMSGVLPDPEKLNLLAEAARRVERVIGRKLDIVSGGSSIDLPLLMSGVKFPPEINHLRVGGVIANPCSIRVNRGVIFPGTREDTVTLSAEVVEVQTKRSCPPDGGGKNWSGETVQMVDRGMRRRAILALGSQDIGDAAKLIPLCPGVSVVGCSSDHTVLDVTDSAEDWRVGRTVSFRMLYPPLLCAFSTRHVEICYRGTIRNKTDL